MLICQRFSQQIVILFGKMMIPIKIWRISPTKSDKTHMDCVRSAPALQEWCQRQILQKQLVWHLWQAYVIWAHHLIFPTIETQDGRCRDDIPTFLLVTSDLQWPSHVSRLRWPLSTSSKSLGTWAKCCWRTRHRWITEDRRTSDPLSVF